MSLNWDATKVASRGETPEERIAWNDAKDFSEEHDNWTLLETLIWRSMSLGWGWALTEKNLERALIRNFVYEQVFGGVKIPAAFIEAMVGLSTNVGELTDAAFWKNLRGVLEREAKAKLHRYRDEQKKAAEAVTTSEEG